MAVEAANGVEQPVDDRAAEADASDAHGRHELPLVLHDVVALHGRVKQVAVSAARHVDVAVDGAAARSTPRHGERATPLPVVHERVEALDVVAVAIVVHAVVASADRVYVQVQPVSVCKMTVVSNKILQI